MRGALILVALVCAVGCGEPEAPPTPRPPAATPAHCTVQSFESADGVTVSTRVRTMNQSDSPLAVAGTLTVGIEHDPGGAPGRPHPITCSGTVHIDPASSYPEGATGPAVVTARIDPPCPPPPPGSTVLVRVTLLRDGAREARGCDAYGLAAPPVFGGGGLNFEEQQRAHAREAIDGSPDFVAARAYADRLGAVVAALPAPAGVAVQPCALPEDARGPLLSAMDYDLASIAAPNDRPLRAPQTLDPYGDEYPVQSPALRALGLLLHEGRGEAAQVRRWLDAHTPYVAVVQVRSFRPPMESGGGSQDAVHQYTPGSFEGLVTLADVRTARVLCAQTFTATDTSDFRQRPHAATLHSQMRSAFAAASLNATWTTLRALAPESTVHLIDPPAP